MKSKTVFICKQCGNETPRWQGQCPRAGPGTRSLNLRIKDACRQGGRPVGLFPLRAEKLKEVTGEQEITFPPACMSLTGYWAAAGSAGR